MMRGLQIQWKSDTNVEKYAKELRKCVTEFEEAVNDVIEKIARIDEYLEELQTSELDREILAEKIEKIQKSVDVFEVASYSNLQIWVDELDKRIADILIDRLERRIQQWTKEFTSQSDDSDTTRSVVDAYTLKIKMQNQTFILDPPLAEARAHLYTQLHTQVEIVCGLKRVEAQRYAKYKGQDSQREKTYMSLVKQMRNYNITEAYESLEEVLKTADAYFGIWK